jgi:hypothetical protein
VIDSATQTVALHFPRDLEPTPADRRAIITDLETDTPLATPGIPRAAAQPPSGPAAPRGAGPESDRGPG